VRAVSIATRRVTTVVGTPSLCGNADGPVGVATFCDPAGLAFRQGVLFVADASSHTIRRVDLAAGTVATVAGTAFAPGNADGFGATARLSSPSALAFVGDALFVVDGDDGRVRRVDVTTGEVSSIAGARFDGPSALARGEGDTLLVVDRAAVSRLSIATGKVEKLFSAGPGLRTGTAAPALGHPASLVELASGDALVVDRSENAVLRLLF
jgi:hypothetical protein